MCIRDSILVLPYDEASQSGILVQGIENQIIYVATPVGALPEQNLLLGGGIVAENMTSKSFADSLEDACSLRSIEISTEAAKHTWSLEVRSLLLNLEEIRSSSNE